MKNYIISLSLALLALPGCTLEKVKPKHTYSYYRNMVYKEVDGKKLSGDMYIPDQLPNEKIVPRPAVLVVHGGGWNSKFGDMNHICRALAEAGFVAYNITYRLVPNVRFPKPVEDVTDALTWLYDHAEKYGINRDHISGWGYSAGSHLTLLAGLDPKHHMHSIVVGGAPGNLSISPNNSRAIAFVGYPYKGHEALWDAASPVTHAEAGSPPTFFYHGTADTSVEPIQMQQIRGALDAKGAKTETFLIEGAGHIPVYAFSREAIIRGIRFLETN